MYKTTPKDEPSFSIARKDYERILKEIKAKEYNPDLNPEEAFHVLKEHRRKILERANGLFTGFTLFIFVSTNAILLQFLSTYGLATVISLLLIVPIYCALWMAVVKVLWQKLMAEKYAHWLFEEEKLRRGNEILKLK
ncbi:MAG: hypothetical protein EOP06_11535 [Proteobacteria bacterium]|nr:MAG: hypothetical protein EOP06_11535 [Pseudomonadota bacterium]